MDEIADLKPGDELDNERLRQMFGCGPQGGMRRSLKTNTLVLICNHVESIYDDRWIDGVLRAGAWAFLWAGCQQRGFAVR